MNTQTKTKAQLERERVENNQREAFAKKVRTLLGHVSERVPASDLNAAFDAIEYKAEYGPAAEAFAAAVASREPVGAAIHPSKAEAVRSAREQAEKVIERVRKELDEAGWDIEQVAPYPNSMRESRASYTTKKAKYTLFHSLVETAQASRYRRPGQPHIVEMSEKGINRFVQRAEEDAALQYDAFIVKMVAKVGAVRSARLEGSHVWGYSFLFVETEAGEVQKWKTQQITNYSSLGTPYLQWPSRIVK